MRSVSLASKKHLAATPKPGMFAQLARKLVLKHLQRINIGCINLTDGHFKTRLGQPENEADLVASIEVLDASFYADIAFGGSIGAGEAYMQGSWRCEDLVSLVRILVRNRHVLDDMEKGSARLTRPLQKVFHWFNRNTREGARRNISAHYDLGNDFFSLWLDESMMYSSAMFERHDQSLAEAQQHRLDVVCEKLELGPDDHIVEIGTGWVVLLFTPSRSMAVV